MSITELIKTAGEQNVQVQSILNTVAKINRRKHHSEMTVFVTHEMGDSLMDAALHGKKGSHIGLILWIPTDALESKEAKP